MLLHVACTTASIIISITSVIMGLYAVAAIKIFSDKISASAFVFF